MNMRWFEQVHRYDAPHNILPPWRTDFILTLITPIYFTTYSPHVGSFMTPRLFLALITTIMSFDN